MKTYIGTLGVTLAMIAFLHNPLRVAAVAAERQPTLSSAEAVFDTLDNDKDHDTLVTVTVKRGNTIIAAASNVGGHWNDHSSHTVALDVGSGWGRDQLESRTKTDLFISTNGNDKWEFNYTLRL